MTDKTLPDLMREFQHYLWMVETSGGELTPELEAQERYFATAFAQKGTAIKYIVDRLRALAEVERGDARVVTASARAKENAADRLVAMAKAQLMALGIDHLDCGDVQFILRDSAPKVEIDDAQLPTEYWREEIVRTPDRKQIEHELKQGNEVPGAKLVPVRALLMKKGRRV